MRALPFALLALLVAGCFGGEPDARAGLVPYPRLGDVAVYEVVTGPEGAVLVDFARWENGIPLASAAAQVRLTVAQSADAMDGARALHAAYLVRTEVAEAGVFDLRSERYVSVRHQAVVQSFHPLSQDQSIVAFDERGFPWLWGASALFGEDLSTGAPVGFELPDNLGRGAAFAYEWRANGTEDGLARLDLHGPGASGALWMRPGSAWPERVRLRVTDELAPHVRLQAPLTAAQVDLRLVSVTPGADPVPPRDRGETFATDESVAREPWDGEKPPDGDITALAYPLAEAVRDAKLLDKPLQDWLAASDTPILYRGTYQMSPGPVEGSQQADWLLGWVDRADRYYELQIARVLPPASPAPLPAGLPVGGVPVVESSAPVDPPANEAHGWFEAAAVPERLVTLSEAMRVVRETFGAQELQIFLRSFADPPGHSYFIDGGFDGTPASSVERARPAGRAQIEDVGRYTVVYHPATGFIEEATGPVTPRLSAP